MHYHENNNIYNINNNVKLVGAKFVYFLIYSNKIYGFSSIVIFFLFKFIIHENKNNRIIIFPLYPVKK